MSGERVEMAHTWRTREPIPMTIGHAACYAIAPDPYSYETTTERAAQMIDSQAEVVGRLLEALHESGVLPIETIARIIGSGCAPIGTAAGRQS